MTRRKFLFAALAAAAGALAVRRLDAEPRTPAAPEIDLSKIKRAVRVTEHIDGGTFVQNNWSAFGPDWYYIKPIEGSDLVEVTEGWRAGRNDTPFRHVRVDWKTREQLAEYRPWSAARG